MKNKRGVSKVIASILLMLLVIVVIFGIVYGIIMYFTDKGDDEIILDPILVNLDIISAYINYNNDSAIIAVSRTGEGEINTLKFIFNTKTGLSYIYEYPNKEGFPQIGDKKVYEIKASFVLDLIDFSEIDSVSIAFSVPTKSGGEVTSIIKDTFGRISSENVRDPKNNLTVNTPSFSGSSGSSGSSGGSSPVVCVPSCVDKFCGDDGCGGSCGNCSGECVNGICELILNNQKDMAMYSEKEAFLVSDRDWKEILPYVPLSVWTGKEDCQKGTGTPEDVCVYPVLVYHSEDDYNLPESSFFPSSDMVYSVNGKSLVRIYLDKESYSKVIWEELDIADYGEDYLDIVVTDPQRRFFEEKGYNLEIIPVSPPKFDDKIEDSFIDYYHTYDSMINELTLIQENYSSIAKLYDIGQSIEGRRIVAMKISDNPGIKEEEKRILVAGNHHARELITVEVPLYMINYLVKNYDIDLGIKEVVDNHELWFVPMVNPDGHVIVETTDIWWRKNARDNNEDGVIDYNDGVDLNRNYGYSWGYDNRGSSPNPGYESYRGTEAFSEPETYAIMNLSINNQFDYVLDYHAYGGMILYPWGHIREATPDDDLLSDLARNFTKYLVGYRYGRIPDVVGFSNGDSVTWHYGDQINKSKTIAFGIEVDSTGFIPPEEEIIPISKKQLMVLLDLTGYEIPIVNEGNVDIDSIIYFLQQYSPNKLTLIGETSLIVDNLLIADSPFGAGLSVDSIKRMNSENYLSYWKNYSDIVFVEDNYEIALVASTYASLINSPLIVKGSSLDVVDNYDGKNVICIGNVVLIENLCSETYSLNQIKDKYLEITNTKKIILTNPDDLNIYFSSILKQERTANSIKNIYSKDSLISPFLASSKHELILTNNHQDLNSADNQIEEFFNNNYNEKIERCEYDEECSNGFEYHNIDMKGVKNTITFFISGKADVMPYRFSPSLGEVGIESIISVGVKNIGLNISENVNVELYLLNKSGDSGGGGGGGGFNYGDSMILLGSKNIGDLEDGEEVSVEFKYTPTKTGYHTMIVNVTTSSEEFNPDNNLEFYGFQVAGPMPNIAIDGGSERVFKINKESVIYFNVSNIGSVDSGEFIVNIKKGNLDGIYKEINIENIKPDETKTYYFNYTPVSLGGEYFRLEALINNDLDYSNNYDYIDVHVTDIAFDIGFDFDMFPFYFGLIDEINYINISMLNRGYDRIKNSRADIYIIYPNLGDEEIELFDSILYGEIGNDYEKRKIVTLSWVPNMTGGYRFLFNISYETDSGEGSLLRTIYIESKKRGSDIRGWIWANNMEVNSKDEKFFINVYNDGSETAKDVKYYIYDNDNLLYSVDLGDIGPGINYDKTYGYSSDKAGRHELKLEIECFNDINNDNNNYTNSFYVYELMDLSLNIIDSESDYVPRYVGIVPKGDGLDKFDFINGQTVLSVPNFSSDIYIINSDVIPAQDAELAGVVFLDFTLASNLIIVSERYKDFKVFDDKKIYDIYANNGLFSYEKSYAIFYYPDYRELGINEPDNLKTYYCTDWDFSLKSCSSEWKDVYSNKNVRDNMVSIESGNVYERVMAYAVGEDINSDSGFGSGGSIGGFNNKINFKKINENYKIKKYYEPYGDYGLSNYQTILRGFFYNCSSENVDVEIYFNHEDIGTVSLDCYDSLPKFESLVNLGEYSYDDLRNITLIFDSDLIFYNVSNIINIYKDYKLYIPFGEEDSTGLIDIFVAKFGAFGESGFSLNNQEYKSFVLKGMASYDDLTNLEIYLNDLFIGELDLNNSNSDKSREFIIPESLLNETKYNVRIVPENSGKSYLADIEFRSDFNPYYLTIIGSPLAIPFEDSEYTESDFRYLGDIDGDFAGEFSVGRIMGLSSSDSSSYVARDLMYDKISKKKGATMMMVGDGYDQRIPLIQKDVGFCKCYFDEECSDLFDKYDDYFFPFESCSQDLINGISQEYGKSDCEELSRLRNNSLYNSSMLAYGGHAGPTGWDMGGRMMSTKMLVDLPPLYAYGFGCASCQFRESRSRSDLFCTNMLRKGAIGYQGAVENIPGNHFLDDIFNGLLINKESIGYSFKVAKNKEVRYDWKYPVFKGNEDLRDEFGVHDILIGDPTFNGRFGI